MDTPLLFYLSVMGAAAYAALWVYPTLSKASTGVARKVAKYQSIKFIKASKDLDDIFMDVPPKWLKFSYGIGPIVLGAGAWVFTQNVLIALVGGVVGVVVPDMYVRQMREMRRQKFQSQLVDSLFILSSSLRAGLSLPQAIEQLATEMSPPASDEFGLVVKAHRLGRSMEHALEGLNERMKLDDLKLITTAIVLARETGGDVTQVIAQLITTIRERKKLFDKVNTLTVQGRFQAYIMSLLPIFFALFVRSFNPGYFDQMMNEDVGRSLLVLAIGLWLVGVFLLRILSRVEF